MAMVVVVGDDMDEGSCLCDAKSLHKLLDAQRNQFHSQIQDLQRIVSLQCRLTGINPLSQEMAAGALSIKIGKKPRDLLNPKAVNFLQGIFAIKDTITKREAREISALSGATVTQVREFFSGQRSRVRKFVHQAKAKSKDAKILTMSANKEPLSVNPLRLHGTISPSFTRKRDIAKDRIRLCNGEIFGKREQFDSNFVRAFLSIMRKESTFSGQVHLLDKLLQIQEKKILSWFVARGGIPVLAKWLNIACAEEQTTVLDVIFKVLIHLPLNEAVPVQMSFILQTMNKLRFYRTPEISNRSRLLLRRWSNLFGKNQSKKIASSSSKAFSEKGLIAEFDIKKRANSQVKDESDSKNKRTRIATIRYSEESNKRKVALPATMSSSERDDESKIIQSSGVPMEAPEGLQKRFLLPSSAEYTKERRKVQLVEDPSPSRASRKLQTNGRIIKNHSRPISTDDIKNAKKRASSLQHRIGMPVDLRNDVAGLNKTKLSISLASSSAGFQETGKTEVYNDESKTRGIFESSLQISHNDGKDPISQAVRSSESINEIRDSICELPTHEDKKLEEVQIAWTTPPEMEIDPCWGVAYGENSKEVDLQSERAMREEEAVYLSENIPFYPRDPWDMELDFDDSLTPEIPLETIPISVSPKAMDEDIEEIGPMTFDNQNGSSMTLDSHLLDITSQVTKETESNSTVSFESTSALQNSLSLGITSEEDGSNNQNSEVPDLELLAILLKNPDLVFALTSDQGSRFSNAQIIALLDLLKSTGAKQENLNTNSIFPVEGKSMSASGFAINEQKSDPMSSESVLQSVSALAELIQSNIPSSSAAKESEYPTSNRAGNGTSKGVIPASNPLLMHSNAQSYASASNAQNYAAATNAQNDYNQQSIQEAPEIAQHSQNIFTQQSQITPMHYTPTQSSPPSSHQWRPTTNMAPNEIMESNGSNSLPYQWAMVNSQNESAIEGKGPLGKPRFAEDPFYQRVVGKKEMVLEQPNVSKFSRPRSPQGSPILRSQKRQMQQHRPTSPILPSPIDTQRDMVIDQDPYFERGLQDFPYARNGAGPVDRVRSLVMNFGKDSGREPDMYEHYHYNNQIHDPYEDAYYHSARRPIYREDIEGPEFGRWPIPPLDHFSRPPRAHMFSSRPSAWHPDERRYATLPPPPPPPPPMHYIHHYDHHNQHRSRVRSQSSWARDERRGPKRGRR